MSFFKKLFQFHYNTYSTLNYGWASNIGPKSSAYFTQQLKKYNENFYTQLESHKNIPESSLKNVRQNILQLSEIKEKDIDIAVFSTCIDTRRYDVAKSYYKFLQKHDYEIDYILHLEYLRMILSMKKTESDQVECIHIIEQLKNQYGFFDQESGKICVQLLCNTSHWRKAIEILDVVICDNNTYNLSLLYSDIATAAFKNDDETLAWDYISKIILCNQYPHLSVYEEYLKKYKNVDTQTFIQKIEKLFKFWNKLAIIPQVDVVHEIAKNCISRGFQATYTSISEVGKCKCCGSKLPYVQEDNINNGKLCEIILEKLNLLVKNERNIIHKGEKRKELQMFLELVNSTSYDVVIDGLNFFYRCQPKKVDPYTILKNALKMKGKILLIIKKHQKTKVDTSMLKKNATVFIISNSSLDDIYILYAAIKRNVPFLSNDFMRQHASFLFDDLEMQKLFLRWVVSHRCSIVFGKGTSSLEYTPKYDPITQKTGCHWHIPCLHTSRQQETNHKKCLAFLNIFQWMCLEIPKMSYDENKNDK